MEGKKVKFKRYIKAVYLEPKDGQRKVKPGTGKYEDDFNNEGVFLHWGLDFQELEFGVGTYSVALVKLEDGTIEEVTPNCLKFISVNIEIEKTVEINLYGLEKKID